MYITYVHENRDDANECCYFLLLCHYVCAFLSTIMKRFVHVEKERVLYQLRNFIHCVLGVEDVLEMNSR